jgi:hypothetical protein
MRKRQSALIGFVIGFLLVCIGCGTNHLDFISPASIGGGIILGSILGIFGYLLGNDNPK